MNTASDDPRDDAPQLPELADDRIEKIEGALFAEIAKERGAHRTRRTRIWIASAAAAVVIVVAAAIAPTMSTLVSGGASTEAGSAPDAPVSWDGSGNPDLGMTDESVRDSASGAADSGGGALGALDSAAPDREVITTASATVIVDDVTAAAHQVADAATAHDGYVESMSVGQSGQPIPVDPKTGIAYDTYPSPDGAWVTIRVPADQLSAVVDDLSELGEVTASSISRQDVTQQTVDLRARTEAAQASVDRLTELMSQAASVADLIAVEAALAERQATLESYQQQLEYFEGQVAMSTLTVTLVPVTEPVEADPAGFTDGLIAGWNGLVATLNGIVIAFGFLIPWIVVVGLAALIVWWIVRAIRRRRTQRRTPVAPVATPDADSAPPTGSDGP
ncbi:DUF4349 domain-containing protein [Microbacterium sp. P5_E9]